MFLPVLSSCDLPRMQPVQSAVLLYVNNSNIHDYPEVDYIDTTSVCVCAVSDDNKSTYLTSPGGTSPPCR